MVGSAIVRRLQASGDCEIITRGHEQLDLTDQSSVAGFFAGNSIDEIYLAAAKVGGIHANNEYPAEFMYQNLMIESNVIHQAHVFGVRKMLFLGSSCIYPKLADQPMTEAALLTGALEPSNESYAVAKIAGIKMCEAYNRQYDVDFRSVMPTNLYGPNDNFHPTNSHVIPALMRRFHEAKTAAIEAVSIWGSGAPRREFLHVDDLAAASVHVMNLPPDDYRQFTCPGISHINVGTGIDCTIRELADTMALIVGFHGRVDFDSSMPDGAPRKLLDVSRLAATGWKANVSLRDGLRQTYAWFLENQDKLRF